MMTRDESSPGPRRATWSDPDPIMKEEGKCDRSFEVSAGLLVSFFSEFCRSVNTLCRFGMSDSLRFKRAVVLRKKVRRSKGVRAPPFECELATAERRGSPFPSDEPVGRNTEIDFGACLSSVSLRTSIGDGCLFHLEPRASDSKPIKIRKQKLCR